jgi:hypothetical protein
LNWDAEEFAVQLTLTDHFFFQQVKPQTYLSLLYKPISKKGAAFQPGLKVILEYIGWFRLISSYTASLICREEPKKRGAAIKWWIKVAKVYYFLIDPTLSIADN